MMVTGGIMLRRMNDPVVPVKPAGSGVQGPWGPVCCRGKDLYLARGLWLNLLLSGLFKIPVVCSIIRGDGFCLFGFANAELAGPLPRLFRVGRTAFAIVPGMRGRDRSGTARPRPGNVGQDPGSTADDAGVGESRSPGFAELW